MPRNLPRSDLTSRVSKEIGTLRRDLYTRSGPGHYQQRGRNDFSINCGGLTSALTAIFTGTMNTSAEAPEDFPEQPALQKLVGKLRTWHSDTIKWQD
jgi:hypothetical protein